MSAREVERLARQFERSNQLREARALRLIARQYGALRLVDVAALLTAYAESPNAARRTAGLQPILDAFLSASQSLATPPTELAQLLTEAVRDGSSTGMAMLNAQTSLLNAFRVDPVRELEYARHAAERLTRYWGAEQDRLRNEVQSALLEGLERGSGSRQIATRLRERVNVSRSRANLIARNELSNAAAHSMRESQLEAGCTHYVWRAAADARVRPEHAARDGETFAWDDPPDDGHPGQPIQCRCVALALMPGRMTL